MSKTLPISEVKTRLPELVSGVAEQEEEIVVTRNGKPAAVLVNYDEYERLKDTLDDVILDIERECGSKPQLVVTSARPGGKRTSFAELREMLIREAQPFLLLLGTGWGLTDTVLAQSDYLLEPIDGGTDYNHLSVRSAAAIILDRLLGK